MTTLLYTVNDLVDEVRSQLDEENVDSVNDSRDILPALNRAQNIAFDILARKYPEPLIFPATLDLIASQSNYAMPENVFEDRIQKVEIAIPTNNGRFTYQELQRVSYRDSGLYESSVNSNVPSYYTIFGRTIRIIPSPSGTYDARIWAMRNPEKLVTQQGRITIVPTAGNYLILDGLGDGLTTESDQLGSYVNVIDGQTGEIKGSLQIQSLTADKATFRTVPLRSTVLGRDILAALTDVAVEQDDYICSVVGTCVPYYSRPVGNFMIRHAVNSIKGKLEELDALEKSMVEELEQQVARTWAGREQTMRVKKRSRIWGKPTRRWYWQ